MPWHMAIVLSNKHVCGWTIKYYGVSSPMQTLVFLFSSLRRASSSLEQPGAREHCKLQGFQQPECKPCCSFFRAFDAPRVASSSQRRGNTVKYEGFSTSNANLVAPFSLIAFRYRVLQVEKRTPESSPGGSGGRAGS